MPRAIVLMLLLLVPVLAEDQDLVSEVFPIGDNAPAEVEALIKQMLSPKGKTVLVPSSRKILVQDDASHMAQIRAVMASLNAPAPNVRIDVTVNESGASTRQGYDVHGRIGTRNSLDVNVFDRNGGTSSLNSQFLMTRSGTEAYIEVGQDVPFVDYFYNYALDRQLLTTQTRWESIGSRLRVRPLVRGNLIDVEVTPEITTLVDGRQQVISYRNLSTVVTVASGATIPVGGFTNANDEFNRNFFTTRAQNRTSTVGTITLKATIQP